MIRFLLHRPIAVFMVFLACFIVGVVTYKSLPISLLPDIAIPEITVQVTSENTSARELENTVMSPLRTQLMQVERLENLHSETRDGSGLIRLRFEHGTNTDLGYIEVNEKVDAVMSRLPKETSRPQVIKASATDIPVLYLNLTVSEQGEESALSFLQLSNFAENVIRRRIEQLPEVAMVDMSGLAHQQVQIVPDPRKIKGMGIGVNEIEHALLSNNVKPGSMTVREGYYEYNIRFSTVVRTVEDVQNIPMRHDGRIIRLGELADVRLMPTTESGLTMYNGKRSVTLAIIKQAEENMDRMKEALNITVRQLKRAYPNIEFHINRNQTELLDYTLSNMQQNLALGFLFILIVASLFMGGVRSPLVIGICMVTAIVISFIFFFLFGMSLNIISLSGLILAEGMMIDNAIIVTENIEQYRARGFSMEEACEQGTTEVITPMLSSSLTTVAVFVPLVFMSGIAGAIFYDEAFAVTVGLAASYIVGIVLLPVLYKNIFGLSPLPAIRCLSTPIAISVRNRPVRKGSRMSCLSFPRVLTPLFCIGTKGRLYLFYDHGINWTFSHKLLTLSFTLLTIPLCVFMFFLLPKERMPEISRTELAIHIDWNENLHLDDNRSRTEELERACSSYAIETNAHIGLQQYLLDMNQTSTTETELYLRTTSPRELPLLQRKVEEWLKAHYPLASIRFYAPENVFEKVFDTNEFDVVAELYNRDKVLLHDVKRIREIVSEVNEVTDETAVIPATQKQLSLTIDRERLILYGISYSEVMNLLKTALHENKVTTLRSYQNYLPIFISGEQRTLDEILDHTLVDVPMTNGKTRQRVPLRSFITVSPTEDLKGITAGCTGEYIPLTFTDAANPEKVMKQVREVLRTRPDNWEVNFSGGYFSDHHMINELTVILFISLLLMYFILAAQFESLLQPLIVLMEIPVDIGLALVVMFLCGISLNLMSGIGIVVSCGVIINDSILKLDMINELRREGVPLMEAIHTAGTRRLRSIVMTSLTTILAMIPLLFTHDMGSELQRPFAIAMIATMLVGTLVSLFVIPLVYWLIYKKL